MMILDIGLLLDNPVQVSLYLLPVLYKYVECIHL